MYTLWPAWTLGSQRQSPTGHLWDHLARCLVTWQVPSAKVHRYRIWCTFSFSVSAFTDLVQRNNEKSIRGVCTWARFSYLKLPHCGRHSRRPFLRFRLKFLPYSAAADGKNPYSLTCVRSVLRDCSWIPCSLTLSPGLKFLVCENLFPTSAFASYGKTAALGSCARNSKLTVLWTTTSENENVLDARRD